MLNTSGCFQGGLSDFIFTFHFHALEKEMATLIKIRVRVRIDGFDLLAVQGTLKSLFQHHSLKTLILWHSAFFMVQISLPYMPTGKTIALTRWTFVGKVVSLLSNMLFRLVMAFLPGSKCLFMATVTICSDFGASKNKVTHCFHCFAIYLP